MRSVHLLLPNLLLPLLPRRPKQLGLLHVEHLVAVVDALP